MPNPPPSLRVYGLARAVPALIDLDLLAERHELIAEIECYVEEEELAGVEAEARRVAHLERRSG